MAQQPRKGYGVAKKLAESIGISTVLMSQILAGTRELSVDQAFSMTEYLQLSELEQKYFLTLVQRSRAGSVRLKAVYDKELRLVVQQAQQISSRVTKGAQLSEEVQAEFYSHWSYSAVRLLTSISKYQTPESIAEYLEMPRPEVLRILHFLVRHSLCIEKNGRYEMGPQQTHLKAGSPHITSRQIQWRLKGFEEMNNRHEEDLFYTAPLTIAKSDYEKLRKLLLDLVSDLTKLVTESDSEELVCVNFDCFKI